MNGLEEQLLSIAAVFELIAMIAFASSWKSVAYDDHTNNLVIRGLFNNSSVLFSARTKLELLRDVRCVRILHFKIGKEKYDNFQIALISKEDFHIIFQSDNEKRTKQKLVELRKFLNKS